MRFEIPRGESKKVLSGTQDYYTLISIEQGRGTLQLGSDALSGVALAMDAMEDRDIVLPPAQSATFTSDSSTLRLTVGQYGGEA